MVSRVPNINEFNIRYVESTDDENVFIGHCSTKKIEYSCVEYYDENGHVDFEKSQITVGYDLIYNGDKGNINYIYLNALDYVGLDTFGINNYDLIDYTDIYQVFLYRDRTVKKVLDINVTCVWDDLTYYFKYNILSNNNIKKMLFDNKVTDGVKDGFKEFI